MFSLRRCNRRKEEEKRKKKQDEKRKTQWSIDNTDINSFFSIQILTDYRNTNGPFIMSFLKNET
jgi:hypothetical protein